MRGSTYIKKFAIGGIAMKKHSKLYGSIGIIVATEEEKRAFLNMFDEPDYIHGRVPGYEIFTWLKVGNCRIHLLCSGYGEIAAAAATQYLIGAYAIDRIINYGAVGGLHEDNFMQRVGIVKKVVHYGFDLSTIGYPIGKYPGQEDLFISSTEDALPREGLIDLPEFVCASADKFLDPGIPKRKIREKFSADICDMESAGVVITCNRNNIPCSLIKAISSGADESWEVFLRNYTDAAKACVEVIASFVF